MQDFVWIKPILYLYSLNEDHYYSIDTAIIETLDFLIKYYVRRNITDFPNTRELDIINIEVSEELIGGSYQIIDYNGKTVLDGTINSSHKVLNVNFLSKGKYYILLRNSDSIITRTFTLQ